MKVTTRYGTDTTESEIGLSREHWVPASGLVSGLRTLAHRTSREALQNLSAGPIGKRHELVSKRDGD